MQNATHWHKLPAFHTLPTKRHVKPWTVNMDNLDRGWCRLHAPDLSLDYSLLAAKNRPAAVTAPDHSVIATGQHSHDTMPPVDGAVLKNDTLDVRTVVRISYVPVQEGYIAPQMNLVVLFQ